MDTPENKIALGLITALVFMICFTIYNGIVKKRIEQSLFRKEGGVQEVPVKVWQVGMSSILPAYQTSGSGGMDIYASLGKASLVIPIGGRALINSGIKIAVPEGYVGLICSRSGLTIKHGVVVANSPGMIDSDYRGEVGVILINHGDSPYTVYEGDRIAQLMLAPFARVAWDVHTDMPGETARGAGGFGSTDASSISVAGVKEKPATG